MSATEPGVSPLFPGEPQVLLLSPPYKGGDRAQTGGLLVPGHPAKKVVSLRCPRARLPRGRERPLPAALVTRGIEHSCSALLPLHMVPEPAGKSGFLCVRVPGYRRAL